MFNDIEIKTFSVDQIEDFHFLHKKTFEYTPNVDLLYKKHNINFSGLENYSQIAYHKNKPIGFCGVYPANMIDDYGTNIRAAQITEFITLEKFRGKGIFKKLVQQSLKALDENNFQTVFGICTETNTKILHKFGFRTNKNDMYRFHIKLSNKLKCKIYWKSKINIDNRILYLKKKLEKKFPVINDITNILNFENNSVSYIYDKNYIDYKQRNLSFIIEINNVKFWVKPKYYFEIGAIEYKSKNDLKLSLETLSKYLEKLFLTEIIINSPVNTKLYNDLTSFIKQYPSWKIDYLDISGDFGSKIKCVSADFDPF